MTPPPSQEAVSFEDVLSYYQNAMAKLHAEMANLTALNLNRDRQITQLLTEMQNLRTECNSLSATNQILTEKLNSNTEG